MVDVKFNYIFLSVRVLCLVLVFCFVVLHSTYPNPRRNNEFERVYTLINVYILLTPHYISKSYYKRLRELTKCILIVNNRFSLFLKCILYYNNNFKL